MGIQINIKTKHMLAAGWHVYLETDEFHDPDTGHVVETISYLVFHKPTEDIKLCSYSPDSFCADCNNWGQNKALFQELGLFNLPHKFS